MPNSLESNGDHKKCGVTFDPTYKITLLHLHLSLSLSVVASFTLLLVCVVMIRMLRWAKEA